MIDKNDLIKLAMQFFPLGWHFTPDTPTKSLYFYKDILVSTKSISMKAIYDRVDQTKVIFHSLYMKKIINMSEWGSHHLDLHELVGHNSHYSYCNAPFIHFMLITL